MTITSSVDSILINLNQIEKIHICSRNRALLITLFYCLNSFFGFQTIGMIQSTYMRD